MSTNCSLARHDGAWRITRVISYDHVPPCRDDCGTGLGIRSNREYDRGMTSWDRIRYTIWAPVYDAMAGAIDFGGARRRSIEGLRLAAGDRVLLVGAGTGLDLDDLPPTASITAVDVTPAMLARLERRATRLGLTVETHVMDGRVLAFPDTSFDAVILHLVLAVMPEPERALREVERVLRPGGRVAILDKFLPDTGPAPVARRLLNLVAKPAFSDLNRRLGPMVGATRLVLERDEPAGFGNWYRIATLRKPGGDEVRTEPAIPSPTTTRPLG